MRKQFASWLGCVAAALALVSALLSIAPFTPAIVLTALTMPSAVVATWLGAWRLGIFSFYWTLLAIIALPNSALKWHRRLMLAESSPQYHAFSNRLHDRYWQKQAFNE